MKISLSASLSGALSKFSLPLFALQWGGNLVLLLLAGLWLHVPDSHIWQLAFSVLFAIGIVALALWMYSRTVRLLRGNATTVRAISLLGFLFVWTLAQRAMDAVGAKTPLFSGYINSKFPASMRVFFSYEHLESWQTAILRILFWIVAAALVPLAIETVANGLGTLRRVLHVYARLAYWVLAVLCGLAADFAWNHLSSWTPGHGLTGEWISLIVRLSVGYTAIIALWCFVLALAAHYLSRESESEVTAG